MYAEHFQRNVKSLLKFHTRAAGNRVYLGRLVVSNKILCLQSCVVQIMKSRNKLHNGGIAFRSEFPFFSLKQQTPFRWCRKIQKMLILQRQSFKRIFNLLRHLLTQTVTASLITHTLTTENLSCSECSNCEAVNSSHPNTGDQHSSKKQQKRYSLKLWKERTANMTSSLQAQA